MPFPPPLRRAHTRSREELLVRRLGQRACGGRKTPPTTDCGYTSPASGPPGAAALPAAAQGGGTPGRTGGRAPGPRGRVRVRSARRAGRTLALLFAAAVAGACTDLVAPGPDAAAPTAAIPDPGLVTVEWTAPPASRDIGVLLELEGPGIASVAAPGLEVHEFRRTRRASGHLGGTAALGPAAVVPDPGPRRAGALEDYGLRDAAEYRAVISSP